MRRKHIAAFCTALLSGLLFLTSPLSALAETPDELVARTREKTIESNEISGWPQGPVVSAESAILIDANTGTILYAKDIHHQDYPASTTKILTTLIAAEKSSLDEIVTFSKRSVFGIPAGSNHIAMDVGNTLTMETCLNAILIRSANEVAYAVAEHIGGSWEDFADMMNARARELGCVDSNFVNPNGLPDENHYTSVYDLAQIGRAFFANDMLCKITTTPRLVVEKPKGTLIENNKMELLPGKKHAYPYLVGCKTGYTQAARYTLVSCAEKNGMKLICAVLRDEYPYVYEDTIALFDYGFANFEKVNIAEAETKYNIDNIGLFYDADSLFDTNASLLSISDQDYVLLPKTLSFQQLTSAISYDSTEPGRAATISYSYKDVYLGSATLNVNVPTKEHFSFDDADEVETPASVEEKKSSFFFVNIMKILAVLGILAAIVFVIFIIRSIGNNFQIDFSDRRGRRYSKERRREIRRAKTRYRSRLKKRRRR